jgi:hypothetical protein
MADIHRKRKQTLVQKNKKGRTEALPIFPKKLE